MGTGASPVMAPPTANATGCLPTQPWTTDRPSAQLPGRGRCQGGRHPSSPPPAVTDAGAAPRRSPGAAGVTTGPGDAGDADVAARLHAGQITEGFLSFLGPHFLRLLYRRIARSPESFLLVAQSGAGVIGYIAGSADVGRLYRRFVVRDGPAAAVAAAGRLARSWRRVAETSHHGLSGVGQGRGTELLAVAVDPDWTGQGVGGALVAAFLAEVTRRGGDAAYVVVAADNAGAIAVYRRAGFAPLERFELHAGATSLLMQWDRGDQGPGGPGPAGS